MKRPWIIVVAALCALLLLLAGYLGGRRQHMPAAATAHVSRAATDPVRAVLYWYDPMVPDQHFDKPGKSPFMDMQLVAKHADDGSATDGVRIDPATVQNLGIRTALVERRVLATTVRVPGTIAWNLREAATVSARVDAVISQLHVRAPYTKVAAGEPLADLLAPQWSSALAEYHALQQAQSPDAKALRGAARERLQALGLAPADIRSAHRDGGAAITLHAPQAGVVTALEVREGQRVSAGQTLLTVNGLDTVWVEAALPQAAVGIIHDGTPVTVTVDALPGQALHGSVETLLPDIDGATRTQRARIVLANPDGQLSPGMFVTVQLNPMVGVAVPVVPDDALISTGQQTRVIVADAHGRFHPVAVRIGRSSGGYAEILEGLHGNEKVVVSGQFLIDSEASLSGALDRLSEGQPEPAKAGSANAPATSHAAHVGHATPAEHAEHTGHPGDKP